ncbi:MAG: phosphotransferase [Acidobacteria bacterium]|nr:phosphotransferase [Acidobacteriota bacterium]
MTDLVHGMGNEMVAPDWPAVTTHEAREILAQFSWIEGDPGVAQVVWRSPRPMSAAAVVRKGMTTVFMKRHHVGVRSRARLECEHEFARHLRMHGAPVPAVLSTTSGESVVEQAEYLYEVHDVARGLDLYRDVPSWHPFSSERHARSAGTALARFHQAARDFAAPGWTPDVLSDSMAVVDDDDPVSALVQIVENRRGLAHALERFDYLEDFRRWIVPHIERVAPHRRALRSQWTHGDWHASNLTWTSNEEGAVVSDILDLGLSNRTTALRDIAIAIERNCVDWLDVQQVGSIRSDVRFIDALLDGYEEVTPLSFAEHAALTALLPVSHVEFALSEIEYFADVVHSEANTILAYEGFLLGHVQWFEGPGGASLLAHLEQRGNR